ncbi:MAG TPA: nucleotidyltransferase family protein [Casimicrobiaceae bacterium]
MRRELLAGALADPASVATPAFAQWEELIRRAREANLLGTLAERIRERSLDDLVPPGPRAHLAAARIRSEAQATAVRRELDQIARALADVGAPIVLLKGAAYFCEGLPIARGRVFTDIDILVPKARLDDVESALLQSGFVTTHTNAYDQRYYRQWMHELPPMQHVRRQTVLDVHHRLLPETSRMHPDSALLFERARPLDDAAGPLPGAQGARFSVLAPEDMTIHCATHLFCDEDFSHAPRDLVDFDGLARHFAATEPDFWARLVARARTLELARPLSYALQWTSRVHGTPVPEEALREARVDAPPFPIRQVMNALLAPALRPTRGQASTRWARRVLYVRGHWLKMPPHLLAWHLTVKAFRREEPPAADDAREPKAP